LTNICQILLPILLLLVPGIASIIHYAAVAQSSGYVNSDYVSFSFNGRKDWSPTSINLGYDCCYYPGNYSSVPLQNATMTTTCVGYQSNYVIALVNRNKDAFNKFGILSPTGNHGNYKDSMMAKHWPQARGNIQNNYYSGGLNVRSSQCFMLPFSIEYSSFNDYSAHFESANQFVDKNCPKSEYYYYRTCEDTENIVSTLPRFSTFLTCFQALIG